MYCATILICGVAATMLSTEAVSKKAAVIFTTKYQTAPRTLKSMSSLCRVACANDNRLAALNERCCVALLSKIVAT